MRQRLESLLQPLPEPRRAAGRVDRLVDRENDVGDADLVRRTDQDIAAAGAAHAVDQPALAQFAEQLFEIGQ